MKHLGFKLRGQFPALLAPTDVAKNQPIFDAARQAGFQVIVNESPAGSLDYGLDQA